MEYDVRKEIDEAIAAGQRAKACLESAQAELSGAKSWGLWDLFGGGLFSSMVKRDKMQKARYNMEDAKKALASFSRELQDVNFSCNLNLETEDFLSFADFFLDSFAVDWMVQDRIHRAQQQVAKAIEEIDAILYRLKQKRLD